jgi:site-specific recombinase XerD
LNLKIDFKSVGGPKRSSVGSTPIRSRQLLATSGINKNIKQLAPCLIDQFIASRRSSLSPRTIQSYRDVLRLANEVISLEIVPEDIQRFLDQKQCTNGGKHGYFRVLRAFYNWLYSRKSGYGLQLQDNPILGVDAPKVEKKILPSLSLDQVEQIIDLATNTRDKAIISLFADSGLRLSELTNISVKNIDWQHRLIKVKCKGNKEGLAPFGQRTEKLMKDWLSSYNTSDRLWNINSWSIITMLNTLKLKTGLPCNPHTFRRTFASILAKRGVDSLHIMRLGRWESISMVDRYTKSVRFEDSLKLYAAIVN